jgi:hypothetical protein
VSYGEKNWLTISVVSTWKGPFRNLKDSEVFDMTFCHQIQRLMLLCFETKKSRDGDYCLFIHKPDHGG